MIRSVTILIFALFIAFNAFAQSTYNVDANGDKIDMPTANKQASNQPKDVEMPSYGLKRGSIGGFIGAGTQINAGAHPAITGGIDIGLAKYVGLYAEGTGVLAYSASIGEFFGGGGVMFSGNNRSRIVPIGRVGLNYGRLELFQWGGLNVPVVRYTGGFDAYLTRHFGIETQVGGMRTIGRYGGENAGLVTFGIFYRTN